MMASALQLISGFLVAKAVDPKTLGHFNGIALILGYLPFLQMGVINGMNREMPFFVGKEDFVRSNSLAACAQAWIVVISAVSFIALLGISFWNMIDRQWYDAAGWLTFAVNGVLMFYGTLYLQTLFRAHHRFSRLAAVNVIQSATGVFLVIAVWFFSFYGLCIRSIGTGFMGLLLLWRWSPIQLRPHFNLPSLLHLVKVGFPIFVVGQVYAWWEILNRTLLLHMMGKESLGLYALSVMCMASLMIIPIAVSQVSYPRITQIYGGSGNRQDLIRYLTKPFLLLVLVMTPVVMISWMALPIVVNGLLPGYKDGISAAQWSVLIPFLASFQIFNNIFNTVGKQHLYLCTILIGITAYGVALIKLTQHEVYLSAFPQAMLIGRIAFILSAFLFLSFMWWYGEGTKNEEKRH